MLTELMWPENNGLSCPEEWISCVTTWINFFLPLSVQKHDPQFSYNRSPDHRKKKQFYDSIFKFYTCHLHPTKFVHKSRKNKAVKKWLFRVLLTCHDVCVLWAGAGDTLGDHPTPCCVIRQEFSHRAGHCVGFRPPVDRITRHFPWWPPPWTAYHNGHKGFQGSHLVQLFCVFAGFLYRLFKTHQVTGICWKICVSVPYLHTQKYTAFSIFPTVHSKY